MTAVPNTQRFTRNNPCPICGGHKDMPAGRGVRCYGFMSSDGKAAHCTREDYAGGLPLYKDDTYVHWLEGQCKCGVQHGEPAPEPRVTNINHARQHRERPRVITTIEYPVREVDGTLVAYHVRQDLSDGNKKIFWKQPNGTLGLNGRLIDDMPLYRVEELHKHPGKTVIVTEGEKACDALRAAGFLAVGTVTGASSTPSTNTLSPLVGRTVCIWEDNDDPGRAHGLHIAGRLAEIGITARQIAWTAAPPRGDAADFFSNHGSLEDVQNMIRLAKPYEHKRFNTTDTGNAERLANHYGGQIRFNWGRGVWHVYDGKRWAVDTSGRLEQLAKETVRAIPQEAQGLAGEEYSKVLKWAASSESDGKRQAMIRLARSEDGIAIQPADLDTDLWLLNVDNGTIDLRTKELRPHNPDDYITRLIPVSYDPTAICPEFDAFLSKIFDNDQELIDYVWRLIGYSLTGSIREQILPVCWGTGANGKSTLLATIRDLLGDYAAEADAESFMEKRNESIREDIAALDGARFVSAVETTDGRRLSEALVKKLTGGERLRARRLYENGYTFLPQFKVWLATNHRPEIRGAEHAIWRRIRLIPFNITITDSERDAELSTKLRSEFPGILARAIDACFEWQQTGLCEPEIVKRATSAYRRDMDILADWIEDRCIFKRGIREQPKVLYADYTSWCERQGQEPIKQRTFGLRLTDHGCGDEKSNGVRYRTGIALQGTQGTQGTQNTESPYRESEVEKFQENATLTPLMSLSDDDGEMEF